jgi:hypothetical protein
MPSLYVTADVNILEQYKSTDRILKVALLTSDRGSSCKNAEELQRQSYENDN